MTDYFHTLRRQIAQHLQNVDLSQPPWPDFLQAVSDAYGKYDYDQRTLEHSLTLSAEELVQANEEVHAIFQAIPDQFFHLDHDGRVISYKSGQSSKFYLNTDRLINKNIGEIVNKEVSIKFFDAIAEVLQRQVVVVFELVVIHDRRVYYYEARMMPVKDKQVVALVRDITERKQAEEQIAYLAYHDSLTGLPNNRLFRDRLRQGIAHAQRNGTMLAVMFLDLDRFKLINDTMGHGIGDRLLQVTADRLSEAIRSTDSIALNKSPLINTSVARLGGDEFTILLEDIENTKAVSRVAGRMIRAVSEPIMLGDQEVYTSTSIGVAVYPADGDDVEMLLKNADAAMYHAKEQGRNNYQFFTQSMNESSVEQLLLENNLRKAITKGELQLYYQPQVSVVSGQLVGMEALIRWQHPEKGFISPAVFIPVAEETGMIMEIGEWVIQQACRQAAEWRDKGFKPIRISVNLSARQLKDERLPDIIASNIFDTGMEARYLGVELTESAIILEPEMALARLQNIKSLGVKLSLDDFGTGYSSLSYLKRFPIDTLKIDQAFIHDVKVDHEDAALVKAIIAMAHGLGMDVVAEGVESQEQLKFLGAHACDTIQGFLFSRPLPAAEIENMLNKTMSR